MATPTAAESRPSAPRILSVDALRGFDMFWILGADVLIHRIARLGNPEGHVWPFLRGLDDQFEHGEWAGFAFYDLIFPLFVFLAGVSLVFHSPRFWRTKASGLPIVGYWLGRRFSLCWD
jgi:predicted acyltransferase